MTNSISLSPRLGYDECWDLLHHSGVGVLATSTDDGPDLFPVNYLVDGRTLLFRTASGTKVEELSASPQAAFSVQGQDGDGHWSVVMRGPVQITTDDVEAVGSGALELLSWETGSKRIFVRLTPTSVKGRRIHRADLAGADRYR